MSTFANRHNNTAPLSESDNDDDYEQNSSINQQNESMMHKVKDVVSKLLHPSFLFSAAGDTSRPKRKRTISVEDHGEEKQCEVTPTTTTNGHSTASKSKDLRRPVHDDEPELTDDEDSNIREVAPREPDLSNIEQQKKRRRTANYQHILSTTTTTETNGTHHDERISPPSNSTTSTSLSSHRRVLDYDSNTTNTTPILLQTSTDTNQTEGNHRLNSAKQRLNIPSVNRSFTTNYDPSQSPLFSLGARKTTETTMSPSRATTNLKSNTNDFSGNFLLATGLAQRAQINTSTTQLNQSSSTLSNPNANQSQKLLSIERQMLGVNYSSINSRRLPYIERLRRRTLQDCIRLNRTLDSEPLSISTIEEHTSACASPRQKPAKAPEKDCGIQCNISTVDGPTEPSRKVQRTFPPADIRNEALSVPTMDKPQNTSQFESSIQTNSSITIEPIKPVAIDITKPKVLGNVTSFSWPKFARAQEEYAKKYPDKCCADNIQTVVPKPSMTASTGEKSTGNFASSIGQSHNVSSTPAKMPIFNASPPRPSKAAAGPIWKCPTCTMEHSAQTASCSMCRGINPNYKRLSAMESTPTSTTSNKLPDIILEETVVSKPTTTTTTTTASFTPPTMTAPIIFSAITTTPTAPMSVPIVTFSLPTTTTTKESPFPMPTATTTSSLFTTPISFPAFGATPPASVSMPVITKESTITIPATTTTAPSFASFSSATTTAAPLFGTTSTLPLPSASISFGAVPSTTSTFPAFGSFSSTGATATSLTSTTSSISTATTTPAPLTSSTTLTFGSSGITPIVPIVTTSAPTISLGQPPGFSFGTSASAPSLTSLASSSTTPATISTTPATTSITSFAPTSFSFGSTSAPTTSTTTTTNNPTFPISSNTGGFSFSNNMPLSSASAGTAAAAATTNSTTSSAPSLLGSNSSSALSGFSFPSAGAPTSLTTTTASNSTPFGFGTSSPPRPFAPSVISSNTTSAVPTFGSGAGFGATSTAAPAFSGFGSTNNSSLFTFGATPNTTNATNPIQTSTAPAPASGGFAFSAASSTAPPSLPPATSLPAFGSIPSTFSFGATPTTSFGASSGSAPGGSPFQFSGIGSAPASNPLAPGGFPATDNNPFSVSDDQSTKRPVIKAKRRAPKS